MGLFTRDWLVENPKATIVLIHGASEHSGRYEHVAAYLNQHGYSVRSGDLPGLGQSDGLRGHIDSFAEYIAAAREWVERARNDLPKDQPLFVLGHSLGGLIATRFIEEYEHRKRLAGLILSSPCLQVKVEVPKWKAGLANVLNTLYPTLRLSSEIGPGQVTRDKEIAARYKTDPLNYHKVSVRWYQELQRGIQEAWEKKTALDIPLLVMQAGEDYLVNSAGTEKFVREVQNPDKQFILYPDLYHEIFNEPEREAVFGQLVNWLNDKCATVISS